MDEFYTRSGDDGLTGLLGEGRVRKDHPVPQTVGAIDEATAALGMARAACQAQLSAEMILKVQLDLYHLMSEISATPENAERFRVIDTDKVLWLEEQITKISKEVEMPKEFIVPGDSQSGAALALARTIVRRAERHVARLHHDGILENIQLLRYLNRLSSLCFVLELFENGASGRSRTTLVTDR